MSDTPKNYESDTPETCEAVERWQQGKINIFDEMARLERERDEARRDLSTVISEILKKDGAPVFNVTAMDRLEELHRNEIKSKN